MNLRCTRKQDKKFSFQVKLLEAGQELCYRNDYDKKREADFKQVCFCSDRLCGLVVRVLGYRSRGPGSIPGTTRRKEVVGLERGPLSPVSTTEELLDRKVAAPV
jgi:hypothetical protein